MNPLTTIRPWILAVGKQYGIRYAEDYRWPDAQTRQGEMYCTYRIIRSEPTEEGVRDLTTASDSNASRRGLQAWETHVQIDLYDSQNGMYELASLCVAAEHNPTIQQLFSGKCSYQRCLGVTNESTWDDEEINYHHRMVVVFEENVEYDITETNAIVETIRIALDPTFPAYDITSDGYERYKIQYASATVEANSSITAAAD